MFADSLARIQRYTDKQFAAYGLDAAEAASLQARFADPSLSDSSLTC